MQAWGFASAKVALGSDPPLGSECPQPPVGIVSQAPNALRAACGAGPRRAPRRQVPHDGATRLCGRRRRAGSRKGPAPGLDRRLHGAPPCSPAENIKPRSEETEVGAACPIPLTLLKMTVRHAASHTSGLALAACG